VVCSFEVISSTRKHLLLYISFIGKKSGKKELLIILERKYALDSFSKLSKKNTLREKKAK